MFCIIIMTSSHMLSWCLHQTLIMWCTSNQESSVSCSWLTGGDPVRPSAASWFAMLFRDVPLHSSACIQSVWLLCSDISEVRTVAHWTACCKQRGLSLKSLKSSFWCSGWTSAAHLHHVHMHRYTECLTHDWLIKMFAILSTWTGVPAECTLLAIHHYSVRLTLHFHFNDVTFFKITGWKVCNLLQIFAVKLNSCAHTQGYTETKSLGVMTPAPPKTSPKAVCMGQRSGSPPKEHFKHEWLCWKNRPNT